MELAYGDDVVDRIVEQCSQVDTGARNIDHIINGTLLPEVSTRILEQMAEGDLPHTLHIGLDDRGRFAYAFGDRDVVEIVPDGRESALDDIADGADDAPDGPDGDDAPGDDDAPDGAGA